MIRSKPLWATFRLPPAYRQAIEEKYRLNDPFAVQVWNYLTAVLQGDFGYSYQNQRPVLSLILERAPRTILLASVGFAFAIPLGMVIGIVTGTTRSANTDKVWTTSALIAYAIPTFWLGQLLGDVLRAPSWMVSHPRNWPPVSRAHGFAWILERARYLTLPVLAFAIHEGMRMRASCEQASSIRSARDIS